MDFMNYGSLQKLTAIPLLKYSENQIAPSQILQDQSKRTSLSSVTHNKNRIN